MTVVLRMSHRGSLPYILQKIFIIVLLYRATSYQYATFDMGHTEDSVHARVQIWSLVHSGTFLDMCGKLTV